MTEAARWLRVRLPDAPDTLVDTMTSALRLDESTTVADSLADAAMRLYGSVSDGAGGRGDALPLLAADALLTHAFLAAAEADADGIEAFALRWAAPEGTEGSGR